MAYPVVAAVNGGNNAVNSSTHQVNLPSGIQANDLLIVFFAADGSPTITFPNEGTDWIQLFEVARGTAVKFTACYRIADGTEGTSIIVNTSVNEMSAHTSYRITGYSGPPEVATATGLTQYPDPPNLSPSWGALDTLWLAACGYDYNRTITAYPTNYTNGRNDRANNTAGAGVGSARRELNAASDNPGQFTMSASDQWVAATLAIKPFGQAIKKVINEALQSSETKLNPRTMKRVLNESLQSVEGRIPTRNLVRVIGRIFEQ